MIARLVALVGMLVLLAGCGGSGGASNPPTSPDAGVGTVGAPGTAQTCPAHRGLQIKVGGITCAQGAGLADAMGPSSAKARFSVGGFTCLRPPSGAVRCTRGTDLLILTGGD